MTTTVPRLDPSPALREFAQRGNVLSRDLGAGYRGLWSDVVASTSGGKRFRPALLTATYLAYGGRDRRLAADVGAAVELLHTAFVAHDDVIDGDRTRRGRPNVSGAAADRAREAGAGAPGQRAYADTAGILAGDLALVGALRAIALCGAPPATLRQLYDLVDRAVHVSAAGELADVGLSAGVGDATVEEVVTAAERKTAAYSFALPLQAGALLAATGPDVVERLGDVGRLAGLAFQLQDDLIGTFGDEAASGKSRLTDLRQGRVTLLVAHARSTPQWASIAPLHGSPSLTPAQADRACALLEASGSRRFVEDVARDRLEAALRLAAEVGLPAELLDWLGDRTRGVLRQAA